MDTGNAVIAYLKARRPEFGKSTRAIDRCVLIDLAEHVGMDQPIRQALTTRRLESWRRSKQDAWGPATDKRNLSRVRMFCRWLVVNGYLKKDPTLTLKAATQPKYVPRGLSVEEVGRLLDACPDERARCVALLMVQVALRACEVSAIELGDLDLASRTLLVHGKGGKERIVPIPDEAYDALCSWLAVRGMRGGPLIWSSTTGNALTPHTISSYLSTWMYDAGVKQAPRDGKSGHALRHTALSDMVRNSMDPAKAQAAAHALIAATQGDTPPEKLGEAVADLLASIENRGTLLEIQQVAGHAAINTTRKYLPLVVSDLKRVMAGRQYGARRTTPLPDAPQSFV